MKISLKAQNQPYIIAVIGLNVVAAYGLITISAPTFAEIVAGWNVVFASVGPVLLGVAALVLNNVVDPVTKARFVYWNWRSPYPSSKAFSDLGPRDPRVNMTALETRHAPLPKDAFAQNILWYSLLQAHADEPSISRSHKESLFLRDYAVLGFIFLPLGLLVGFFRSWDDMSMTYAGLLLVQLGLTLVAARQAGHRLVCNVLALEGLSK